MTALKRYFFPSIPARPPTKKELEKRRESFIRRFVASHAEGNIALSRGHFTLKKK